MDKTIGDDLNVLFVTMSNQPWFGDDPTLRDSLDESLGWAGLENLTIAGFPFRDGPTIVGGVLVSQVLAEYLVWQFVVGGDIEWADYNPIKPGCEEQCWFDAADLALARAREQAAAFDSL